MTKISSESNMKSSKNKKLLIPGSDWLYYKIYCGAKTSDRILTNVIKPVVENLIKLEIIDKWFFIRYADPNQHLRIRFNYSEPSHVGHIINQLYSSLDDFIQEGLVWKVQIDTYQREIERYGTNTIELSEELFFCDSKATVDFIDLIEGDEGEELRWLFSLKAVDNLLNACQYDLPKKLSLLEKLKISYAEEFGIGRPTKKQIDNKFRNHKDKIIYFMDLERNANSEHLSIVRILETSRFNLEEIMLKIIIVKKEEMFHQSLDELIGSYIHMLMNRLFKSKNRLNEMVVYDFLYRYYKMKPYLQ